MQPTDVWGAAAPPPGAPKKERLIAYIDATSVGFDLRLSLPPVCLRCGARDRIGRLVLKLKIDGDLVARAAALVQGGKDVFGAAVRPGDRFELVLPMCDRCVTARRKERNLAIAVLLAPVWVIGSALAASAVSGAIAGIVALGALATAGVLGMWLFVKRTAALKLERVDSDGIVRLGNVHPDAGHAIVEASGL